MKSIRPEFHKMRGSAVRTTEAQNRFHRAWSHIYRATESLDFNQDVVSMTGMAFWRRYDT